MVTALQVAMPMPVATVVRPARPSTRRGLPQASEQRARVAALRQPAVPRRLRPSNRRSSPSGWHRYATHAHLKWSADRVSLIGYTIIPALLIGLIDVQEVKTTTITNTLAFRYGVTNRFELEVRVPYAWSSTDTVERQIFQGTAVDNVYSTSGHNIGDVEMTARYQFNDGGADRLYYVGWLRFKSRTGTDPFSVTTDCVNVCEANTTGTGLPLQNPTGSGFYSLQPGITWLLPTDPAVFFGNFSYLHNFSRNGVSLTLLNDVKQYIGTVHAGDIFGFNFGMGMSLNEKASWSIGYDQSIVWPTSENGQTVTGSVRTTLGTLLVGYSYQLNKRTTLNVSVGAGLTRDTPDLTVTFRLPITF
jgi:hypothetical protein